MYRGTPFGGGSMVDAGLDRPGGDGHYRRGLALTGAEGPPCLRSHWRKPARRHRDDDPPGKIFGALIEEVRFAEDSLLEGDGFELSVPGARGYRFEPSSVAS